MASIFGRVNAKALIGSSGGASLNLAYGLTPPDDTSKIWVQIANEPSSVKVEANRNLVISSNENAKVKTTETIAQTFLYQSTNNTNGKTAQIGNDLYFYGSGNGSSRILGNQASAKSVFKLSDGTSTNIYNTAFDMYSIFTTNNNTLLMICQNTSNYRVILYNYNPTTNTAETITTSLYDYGFDMNRSCWGNNKLYNISLSNSRIIEYSLNGTPNYYLIDITTNYGTAYCGFPVFCNGALYFILQQKNASAYLHILKWDASTHVLTDEKTIESSVDWQYYTIKSFGNKLIITNLKRSTTSYSSEIWIYDTNTKDLDIIDVGYTFYNSYINVDNNTGNIELWGGNPTGSIDTKKTTFSNIYALTENTLDLYYDIASSNNIKLINEATLTMDAPINHAWLGDSNNIAQSVNMYYYDNGTWKGINCSDYSDVELI